MSDEQPYKQFKGWTIPGPRVPGEVEPEGGETLDALSGHFKIFQYRDGHRFSTDDVLTAWYGTQCCPTARRILDLGSGIGSVGMIAAWRSPGARVTTVEAQAQSVRLARKSARFNGIEGRYEIHEGDLRSFTAAPEFDLVLGSPPYFPLGTGVLGDGDQKIQCRFEVRGDIRDYCAAARLALAPGGVFACVFPADQDPRLVEGAAQARLVRLRRRPIVFREGADPLLMVSALMREEDLPEARRARLWTESELIIRTADGQVGLEYSAIKISVGFPP